MIGILLWLSLVAPAHSVGHGGPQAEDIADLGKWIEKHCEVVEVTPNCPIGDGRPAPCGYSVLKIKCENVTGGK